MTSFGHSTKSNFFLSSTLTHFNHGSFGTVPKPVKSIQDEFFHQVENHPDQWFKVDMFKHIQQSRLEVSNLIHASNVNDLVLVENASAAINSILRGLCMTSLSPGDSILIFSTAYNMVKEVLDWMVSVMEVRIIVVKIDFPLESEEFIIKSVQDTLVKQNNIKICVFSHITSIPSIILPIQKLAEVCKYSSKNPNPLVIVDGAHAPGLLDIFVEDIGVDFYTGNLHKWCFTPKGCAFLWTKSQNQSMKSLAPPVIGSSGLHDFPGRFAYTGTRDYTAFASIPAAFSFCEAMGGMESIRKYNHDLVLFGALLCASRWETSLIAPTSMLSSMVDVILPSSNKDDVMNLEMELDEKYEICIKVEPLKLSNGSDVWICRLSGQIYLEKKDFELLAELVLTILQRKS